jgi:hypothetical protein
LRSPFNAIKKLELSHILNSLWKLPSNYRLNFDFLSHILRMKDQTVESPSDPNFLEKAREIKRGLDTLTSVGGSFDTYDQASDSDPVIYNLISENSPEDVEEWLLNVPLTAILMNRQHFPISDLFKTPVVDRRHPRWRR